MRRSSKKGSSGCCGSNINADTVKRTGIFPSALFDLILSHYIYAITHANSSYLHY